MTRTPPAARPTEQVIRDFTTLYLEVEAGLRPARHLRPFLAADLQPALGGCGRQGSVPRIRQVLSQQRASVWEAVVLLQEETRTSALVVSLRRCSRGWRVEEICRPEAPRDQRPPDDGGDGGGLLQTGWAEAVDDQPVPRWQVPVGWARSAPAA